MHRWRIGSIADVQWASGVAWVSDLFRDPGLFYRHLTGNVVSFVRLRHRICWLGR